MRKPTSFYLGLLLFLAHPAVGQQPTETAPAASPSQPPATLRTHHAQVIFKGKEEPLPIYLITGTVFMKRCFRFRMQRFAFGGPARRNSGGEAHTNSRGEFAVRVPEGSEYEVRVQVKNFKEQSQTVKADAGSVQQQLSFRLEPATPGKAGDKK